MKKRDAQIGCNDCINNEPETGCSDNLGDFVDGYNSGMCLDMSYKYYANRSQCERLLKLWDDANGSVAEWRENDRPMVKYARGTCCTSCMWSNHEISCSLACKGMDIQGCSINGHRFYVNKNQAEAILKWHDAKFGTIQDRLEKEKDAKGFDFRVGDDVAEIVITKGVVRSVNGDEVMVKLDGNDSWVPFCKDPERDGGGDISTLHHGHDIVTIKDEKPVRTVEKWLLAWVNNGEEFSKIYHEKVTAEYTATHCDHLILGPYSVQIPE